MVAGRKKDTTKLDARFRFAEDSFPGGIDGLDSHLRLATGTLDGERYLLRLFKKTKTPIDDDLYQIIERGLRRIRRVLSSRRAREVLVEVVDTVQDDSELAILMLDPGSPVSGNSHRVRLRQNRVLTAAGRQLFWRNIARVAEGLTFCHNAGIVHGAVSQDTIFSHSEDAEDYRLGGYEACVHIADSDLAIAAPRIRKTGAISFRQDWIDLGNAVVAILGVNQNDGPRLSAIETRALNRLQDPPKYQLYDGSVVLKELSEVVEELSRAGASVEGELVLYPSRQTLQSDLSAITSGAIPADDTEAIFRFVEEDLRSTGVAAARPNDSAVRIVTGLAIYEVSIFEDARVGVITRAKKRAADDRIYDAIEVRDRLHLSRNRRGAEERILKLGPSAKNWSGVGVKIIDLESQERSPTWYSLIILEVFTLLREQFRIYPVDVTHMSSQDETGLIWLSVREDALLDERRKAIGLLSVSEMLNREFRGHDDRTDWTLAATDTLRVGKERLPEIRYEGSEFFEGKRVYAFSFNELLFQDRQLFLRPRPDIGTERAVRRRLNNIVAASSNIELLRALDDPAQVALDEALRDVASPGQAPDVLDQSKKEAWTSIALGKSINVVVGPPGVGKTFLVSQLVRSILRTTPNTRVLISSQNHETLIHMEEELKKDLSDQSDIVVRIERSQQTEKTSSLRDSSTKLLVAVSPANADISAITASQRHQIKQALKPTDSSEIAIAERVHRDTEHLMLRSSDVTLATTSSHVIEEMIADGEQFDWVIVEEAARANGAELIGALLLGNRRVIIGDHKQLSPFDASQRQKFYDKDRAAELLKTAKQQLASIPDLPPEVDAALSKLERDEGLLAEVLATSARLEEPFKVIAEREEARSIQSGARSSFANILLEQSRMHPAISALVSETFYGGELVPSERVKNRKSCVDSRQFPSSPIVVLDFPPLSSVKTSRFERKHNRSYQNEAEAYALIKAMRRLSPKVSPKGVTPTLVVLSPYQAQVTLLERLLTKEINSTNRTLFGFQSPRGDGRFFYTSDSFQGGEADVVFASLVRNNGHVGSRALGFLRIPQRMNVLLSRARHKLVLTTSLRFIVDAVDGVDPDRLGGDLAFLRKWHKELIKCTKADFEDVGAGATIIEVDENGNFT